MACLRAIAWIFSSFAQAVASKAACSKCAMSANLEPVSKKICEAPSLAANLR